MSKANATEADIIAYVFNATALPWASDTNYYLALHSADPGEGGDQSTNEVAYTGYARVAVTRNGSGWTCAANQAANTALLQFPTCTGGSATATHISIGRLAGGVGQVLYKGALTSPLAISNNITPQFAAAALTITED